MAYFFGLHLFQIARKFFLLHFLFLNNSDEFFYFFLRAKGSTLFARLRKGDRRPQTPSPAPPPARRWPASCRRRHAPTGRARVRPTHSVRHARERARP